MLSQKKNNGFLKIPNEIADAFQLLHLSGNQWRLLWVIIRFTYGWNKPTDRISLSLFEKHTKMERRNLKRNLDVMVERNIIHKDGSGYIAEYGLHENYVNWKTGVEMDTSVNNDTTTSVKTDTETSVNNDTYKRQIKTIKYSPNSDEFRLAQLLFNLILKRNPTHKTPDLQKWASNVEKMIRLDNRNVSDIETLIRWCQSSDTKESKFWSNSILCTETLRKQFDRLMLIMGTDKAKINPPEIDLPLYKPLKVPVRTSEQKEKISKILKEAKKVLLAKDKARTFNNKRESINIEQ